MISLDLTNKYFCDQCGSRCYIEIKFDGFMWGGPTYKLYKTCPHANLINFKGHAQQDFIDYVEED
jgi:hypothetical protein